LRPIASKAVKFLKPVAKKVGKSALRVGLSTVGDALEGRHVGQSLKEHAQEEAKSQFRKAINEAQSNLSPKKAMTTTTTLKRKRMRKQKGGCYGSKCKRRKVVKKSSPKVVKTKKTKKKKTTRRQAKDIFTE
jgi:hypothetical protein